MSPYGNGGLNIGSLNNKNLALIGKWWWRFKTESGAFWVKIIKSIYGSNGGLFAVRDSHHSLWGNTWSSIIHERFARLYRLEVDKNVSVKSRLEWNEAKFGWRWNWCSNPRGRTRGELDDLISLLSSSSFDNNRRDSWKWSLSSNGVFNVCKLSALINEESFGSYASSIATERNNLVPKKLEVFVWKAMKRRLPVRIELDKRFIELHSVRCPLCDDDLESVEHSLLFCKHAFEVWDRIYKWWNLGVAGAGDTVGDDGGTVSAGDADGFLLI
ncbi:uncharacterized protein [Rutidosis leptorrhynchoides]|uniref:uncharacterized protein n=1 Tax=Rutidosis leptorrhynchoides TaxID=125765 RepID=UPI003A9927CC